MNEAIKMQLSAFVDGELPENESELLLRRLSQDAELRQRRTTQRRQVPAHPARDHVGHRAAYDRHPLHGGETTRGAVPDQSMNT